MEIMEKYIKLEGGAKHHMNSRILRELVEEIMIYDGRDRVGLEH